MKQIKILLMILPFSLLILLLFIIVYGILNEPELPMVGLKLQSVETDKGGKLICEVYNKSDTEIHFKDYNIARGVVQRALEELEIEETELITKDKIIQLAPGENYYTEFLLEDLEPGHYSASVTTLCIEGTTITMGIQFDVD